MNFRSFSLEPFPAEDLLPKLEITGQVGRSYNTLAIDYKLHGRLSELAVPALTDIPERKSYLWEETCLELFLARKDSDHYWELNLSPSGHWNVYSFRSYRNCVREELAFTSLPFSVQRQPDALLLSLEIDLGKIVRPEQKLEVAVSAVIKDIDGRMSYWALAHPGPQPDFHLRDGFILGPI